MHVDASCHHDTHNLRSTGVRTQVGCVAAALAVGPCWHGIHTCCRGRCSGRALEPACSSCGLHVDQRLQPCSLWAAVMAGHSGSSSHLEGRQHVHKPVHRLRHLVAAAAVDGRRN